MQLQLLWWFWSKGNYLNSWTVVQWYFGNCVVMSPTLCSLCGCHIQLNLLLFVVGELFGRDDEVANAFQQLSGWQQLCMYKYILIHIMGSEEGMSDGIWFCSIFMELTWLYILVAILICYGWLQILLPWW